MRCASVRPAGVALAQAARRSLSSLTRATQPGLGEIGHDPREHRRVDPLGLGEVRQPRPNRRARRAAAPTPGSGSARPQLRRQWVAGVVRAARSRPAGGQRPPPRRGPVWRWGRGMRIRRSQRGMRSEVIACRQAIVARRQTIKFSGQVARSRREVRLVDATSVLRLPAAHHPTAGRHLVTVATATCQAGAQPGVGSRVRRRRALERHHRVLHPTVPGTRRDGLHRRPGWPSRPAAARRPGPPGRRPAAWRSGPGRRSAGASARMSAATVPAFQLM